jgi:hypothetical protein
MEVAIPEGMVEQSSGVLKLCGRAADNMNDRDTFAIRSCDSVDCGELSHACIAVNTDGRIVPKVVMRALRPLTRAYPSAAYAAFNSLPALTLVMKEETISHPAQSVDLVDVVYLVSDAALR